MSQNQLTHVITHHLQYYISYKQSFPHFTEKQKPSGVKFSHISKLKCLLQSRATRESAL